MNFLLALNKKFIFIYLSTRSHIYKTESEIRKYAVVSLKRFKFELLNNILLNAIQASVDILSRLTFNNIVKKSGAVHSVSFR